MRFNSIQPRTAGLLVRWKSVWFHRGSSTWVPAWPLGQWRSTVFWFSSSPQTEISARKPFGSWRRFRWLVSAVQLRFTLLSIRATWRHLVHTTGPCHWAVPLGRATGPCHWAVPLGRATVFLILQHGIHVERLRHNRRAIRRHREGRAVRSSSDPQANGRGTGVDLDCGHHPTFRRCAWRQQPPADLAVSFDSEGDFHLGVCRSGSSHSVGHSPVPAGSSGRGEHEFQPGRRRTGCRRERIASQVNSCRSDHHSGNDWLPVNSLHGHRLFLYKTGRLSVLDVNASRFIVDDYDERSAQPAVAHAIAEGHKERIEAVVGICRSVSQGVRTITTDFLFCHSWVIPDAQVTQRKRAHPRIGVLLLKTALECFRADWQSA